MSNAGPHVSISAETLFQIGPLAVTNSIHVSLIVTFLLITFSLVVYRDLKNKKISKIRVLAELLYETIFNFVNSITGDDRKTKFFTPFFLSFFLFILLNNWLGLVPGVGSITITKTEQHIQEVQASENTNKLAAEEAAFFDSEHQEEIVLEEKMESQTEHEETNGTQHQVPLHRAGTADLNTTIALALISVALTQIFGVKYLGLSYFKKFFNFGNPIQFFVGILEIISEFAKVISFAFRLFGNIFAGEVLLAVIGFIVPVIFPIPFYGLEIFVGLIQALVFSILSVVFFNMATESHESH